MDALALEPLDPEKVLAESEMEFLRAGGPGGQHRNRRETGVRLVHVPTGIVVMATERRSQAENRRLALERLVARLERLRKPRKPRRKTRKPSGVRAGEVERKRRAGKAKAARRKVASRNDD
jgi:protein subunit release factor A